MKSEHVIAILLAFLLGCSPGEQSSKNFEAGFPIEDEFENGLSKWTVNNPEKFNLVETENGHALELIPGSSNTYILLKGSENWTNYRVEGDVLFPENDDNYLGFIYNYQVNGNRIDYGCIYIKGNDSYVRVNPHRDDNVSRVLYDEYKTPLTGSDGIVIGQWQHFKAEVKDSICHFYVGDMSIPKVSFNYHEFTKGQLGFEPRVAGSSVWIDNILVEKIDQLGYRGIQPTGIEYEPEKLLTAWEYLGPFKDLQNEEVGIISGTSQEEWKQFSSDGRGCVLAGKVVEWASLKRFAYFKTTFNASANSGGSIHLSTTSELSIWLNGEPIGDVPAMRKAWYDFHKNPMHAGTTLTLNPKEGVNTLVIRVESLGWFGYAGDGFYALLNSI
ncbi:MAG: hypothetical protein ABJP45_10520 [Cyclobacteriaceae bacterium]